jgi:hypothetical protein
VLLALQTEEDSVATSEESIAEVINTEPKIKINQTNNVVDDYLHFLHCNIINLWLKHLLMIIKKQILLM